MDQESGVATGVSFISLNDNEKICYSGLHALCQPDSSGKLSASKVGELFRASQLPAETLHQVTEVCGAKRRGYFGTAQFYVALKLLAAAQNGVPVRLESVKADLPLPRFIGITNEPELWYSPVPPGVHALGQPSAPVPRITADRSAFRHPEGAREKKVTRNVVSPSVPLCVTTPLPIHLSLLPSLYESRQCVRPIAQLEQHSSPSHYGTKPPLEPPAAIALAPSGERLAEQGAVEPSDDPWRITEEQREYYTNQFKTLQPDLGALILGTIAKNFFTKSKLPIPELSHIWELSDVDRDGALTFAEFCTAFHLIVARKNGYPLPETLPPTLRAGYTEEGEDLPDTPESTEPLIVFEDTESRPFQLDKGALENQPLRPAMATSKQGLKEDPHNPAFSPKRVAETNKEATTEGKLALQVGTFQGRPEPPHELDPHMKSKTRPRSYSSTSIDEAMKKSEEPPTPPPRPQKSHSRASSLDLNKLLQQGAQGGVRGGWLPLPPALPPRPPTSQVPPFKSVADKTPQKKVMQPNFADFSRFREEEETGDTPEEPSPLRRAAPSTEDLSANTSKQEVGGASHTPAPQKPIRRKLRPESQNLEATPPATAPFAPLAAKPKSLLSRQKREIQMAIRKNKETNAVLTRLNSELQQQLKDVHQERITLESQLEVLRPLASA
ncbi:ralBP1-associated Eps domain-containing protein 2 [Aplochiton taeniatus]